MILADKKRSEELSGHISDPSIQGIFSSIVKVVHNLSILFDSYLHLCIQIAVMVRNVSSFPVSKKNIQQK